MRISIIVPVLNEGSSIRSFLQGLRERAANAEIIVVDGMSSDETQRCAANLCDRLVESSPGRARQMNAGARTANGDILWFVHSDTTVPKSALAEIERALQDRQVVGGFFRIRIAREQFVYRFTDSFAHYAGLFFGVRCGDHAFFCRREIFRQIGGFPEVDLMEDVDFFRALRRAGQIAVVTQRLTISPRRYETVGPWRLTFAFGLIWIFYFMRAPREMLQRIYRRLCVRSQRTRLPSPAS